MQNQRQRCLESCHEYRRYEPRVFVIFPDIYHENHKKSECSFNNRYCTTGVFIHNTIIVSKFPITVSDRKSDNVIDVQYLRAMLEFFFFFLLYPSPVTKIQQILRTHAFLKL